MVNIRLLPKNRYQGKGCLFFLETRFVILYAPQGNQEARNRRGKAGYWWLTCCLHALMLTLLLSTPYAGAEEITWRAPIGGQLTVVQAFEKPAAKWSAGHRGVDLALEPQGSVLAPAKGTVVFSGTVVDRQVITIEHPDGRKSSFEPVTAPLPVGSQVSAGDTIAYLAPQVQHRAGDSCLHWGVREPAQGNPKANGGMDYINPLLLLGLEKPSVLLPIGDDFAA